MVEELPDLETTCTACGGTGGRGYEDGERVRCGVCHGAGHTLTPFGAKVYAMVRHQFLTLLEDTEAAADPYSAWSADGPDVEGADLIGARSVVG